MRSLRRCLGRRLSTTRLVEVRLGPGGLSAWEQAGFHVDRMPSGERMLRIGTALDLCEDPSLASDDLGVTLASLNEEATSTSLDGIDARWVPTFVAEDLDRGTRSAHENGAIGVEAIVLSTDDVDRTVAACEGLGFELGSRVSPREGVDMAFFRRKHGVVLEVVGPGASFVDHARDGRTQIWGLTVTTSDLAHVEVADPWEARPIRDAIQPNRQIMSMSTEKEGLKLAFITPHHK